MKILVSVFVTHTLNQLLGKNSFRMALFLLFFCVVLFYFYFIFFETRFGKVRMHNNSEQHLYIFIDVRNLTNTT